MRDFIPTWYQVTSQSDVFSIFAGLSSKFFPLFNRTTEEISGFWNSYFGFPDDFEVNTLQMQLIKAHIH